MIYGTMMNLIKPFTYHDELDQAFYLGIDRCKEFSWSHITEKFLNLLNQLK